MSKFNIGLFGFGVVGEGIYNVISQQNQLDAEIVKIVVKQESKSRNAPSELFSLNQDEIFNNSEINLIVELIDDADAAYQIVKRALLLGKSVVSANKKMIANHHQELIALSKKRKVSFLYEAAVCGSVPIIRNLEEYFDHDELSSVQGIVNGSTNFILSQMSKNGVSFNEALTTAQEKGFAESDPTLDVEGVDAAYKLSLICLHGFGSSVPSNHVIRKGITSVNAFDIQFGKKHNLAIKLIAQCHTSKGNVQALSVFPTFVQEDSNFGRTDNEYNSVKLNSAFADEQYFYGKGAGRYPTSAAVLSDISALSYGYAYAYKKGVERCKPSNQLRAKFFVSFDAKCSLDRSIFDKIDEEYNGHTRSYVVGAISLKKLNASGILNDDTISVVCYN